MKRVLLLIVAVSLTIFTFAQDAAEQINQANEAMQAKEYSKALELYESAMSNIGDIEVPNSINYNIGIAAINSDNNEKAITYFEKALTAEGVDKAACYNNLGKAYNDLENYEKAVENWAKAIELDSDNAGSLSYNAGVAAYKGKLYNEAIEHFGKAVELGVRPETCIYYKANAYKQLGDEANYQATLEEGYEKFPNDDKIQSSLTKIYFDEGYALYQQGAEKIKNASEEVNNGNMTTLDEKYTKAVEDGKNDFQQAIPLLKKALAIDPNNENAKTVLDACEKSI